MIPYTQATLSLKALGLHLEYGYSRQKEISSFTGINTITTNPDTNVAEMRKNPLEPCAKYAELIAMKSKYRVQFGEPQLEVDYKTAQEKIRSYGDKNL